MSDSTIVVILHDDDVAIDQSFSKRARSCPRKSVASGILGSRLKNHETGIEICDGPAECFKLEPLNIERYGYELSSISVQKIEDRRKARIFYDHTIAIFERARQNVLQGVGGAVEERYLVRNERPIQSEQIDERGKGSGSEVAAARRPV